MKFEEQNRTVGTNTDEIRLFRVSVLDKSVCNMVSLNRFKFASQVWNSLSFLKSWLERDSYWKAQNYPSC